MIWVHITFYSYMQHSSGTCYMILIHVFKVCDIYMILVHVFKVCDIYMILVHVFSDLQITVNIDSSYFCCHHTLAFHCCNMFSKCTSVIKGFKYEITNKSWIYNYLCNQCLSPLKLRVQTPFMAKCS